MFGKLKEKDRKLLRGAASLAVVVLLAWCCSRFFYQLMLIQGDSMRPSYHHLQLVILNKTDREFHRGEVIAFRCPGLSSVLVKRIVACPGETGCIRDGTLYVDSRQSDVYPAGAFGYAGLLEEPVSLPEDGYLVIGDNIGESRDSRFPEVGIVQESDIIGKVR